MAGDSKNAFTAQEVCAWIRDNPWTNLIDIVDQVFHIGGLKDLQVMCVCDQDPTGEKLLPTGVPEKYSQHGSPSSENFLFGSAGLSFADLNNRGIVAFTVKWPKRS